ncbi:MAG: hypothetical protein D3903_17905 [Candidatus Electrothrix sp. GM3_4]|nr:hypothetical protein [Candidatus Electrothrix sp. GM3_4]
MVWLIYIKLHKAAPAQCEFNADIFRIGITINEKIKPQGLVKWDGTMPYNQFIHEHVHFAGYTPEDLKVRLENENIVYV